MCCYYLSHCNGKHGTHYKITRVCLSSFTAAILKSISMTLYTICLNPKSKIEFVMGQNPTTPSPISQCFSLIMHIQCQGLNTTVMRPVDRLWRFIAQRRLLTFYHTWVPRCCHTFLIGLHNKLLLRVLRLCCLI